MSSSLSLRSLQASWSNYANAYRSLNDLARNLASIEECIKRQDLRMAGHHLRAAEWHPGQAKQRIAAVGRLSQGSKSWRVRSKLLLDVSEDSTSLYWDEGVEDSDY